MLGPFYCDTGYIHFVVLQVTSILLQYRLHPFYCGTGYIHFVTIQVTSMLLWYRLHSCCCDKYYTHLSMVILCFLCHDKCNVTFAVTTGIPLLMWQTFSPFVVANIRSVCCAKYPLFHCDKYYTPFVVANFISLLLWQTLGHFCYIKWYVHFPVTIVVSVSTRCLCIYYAYRYTCYVARMCKYICQNRSLDLCQNWSFRYRIQYEI